MNCHGIIEDLSGEKSKLQDIMSGEALRLQREEREREEAGPILSDNTRDDDDNETLTEMGMRTFFKH